MEELQISGAVLRWAREAAGLTIQDAAAQMDLPPKKHDSPADRLLAIEAEIERPTRPLVLKMARTYRRPLVAFYLEQPPTPARRVRDFRTLPEFYAQSEEGLVEALVRDIEVRQSLVKEALIVEDEAEPVTFIGSESIGVEPKELARKIAKVIKFDVAEFRKQKGVSKAFDLARMRAEDSGVFVLLASNLGNHKSSVSVEMFRGFALADEVAPFVVINDQDAKAAWSFTLFHELAHLWLGESGISGGSAEKKVEAFCNDVAAHLLLPDEHLPELPENVLGDLSGLAELLSQFASDANLSPTMVAYRLRKTGKLSNARWLELASIFRNSWLSKKRIDKSERAEGDGGPDYYVVRRHRLGRALIDVTGRMSQVGALSLARAGMILGVKQLNVQRLLRA